MPAKKSGTGARIIAGFFIVAVFAVLAASISFNQAIPTGAAVSRPDMIVESVEANPKGVEPNGQTELTIRIKNVGAAGVQTSGQNQLVTAVHYYDLNGNEKGWNGMSFLNIYLGPGEVKEMKSSFNRFTYGEGNYKVMVKADQNNKIDESDETNNEKTIHIEARIKKPDLIMDSVSWTPANPAVGQNTDFQIKVRNIGTKTITPSASDPSKRLLIGLDRYKLSGAYDQGSSRVISEPIAPGESITVTTRERFNEGAGTYNIVANADMEGKFEELNENNNKLQRQIHVGQAGSLPDLIIDDVSWSPTVPEVNKEIPFKFSVRNIGVAKADMYMHFAVEVIEIGSQVESTHVNAIQQAINPGEAYLVNVPIKFNKVSNYRIVALVDSGQNRQPEIIENNNDISIYITPKEESPPQDDGKRLDFVIDSINLLTQNPKPGDAASFSIIIKNEGEKTYIGGSPPQQDGELSVKKELYKDNALIWSDSKLIVTALAPSEKYNHEISVSLPSTGSYRLKAILDDNNKHAESNENNNEKEYTFTIEEEKRPDIVVDSISWTPQEPKVNEQTSIKVKVKNIGEKNVQSWLFNPLNVQICTTYAPDITPVCETKSVYSGNIAPQEIKELETSRKFSLAKVYEVKVTADYDNKFIESNEANNEKTGSINIKEDEKFSDLIVASVTGVPQTIPAKASTAAPSVTIKNIGEKRFETSRSRGLSAMVCWHPQPPLNLASSCKTKTVYDKDIEPSGTITLAMPEGLYFTYVGAYNIAGRVADLGHTEKDETNNLLEVSTLAVTEAIPEPEPEPPAPVVQLPDLIVEAVRPAAAKTGEYELYTYDIKNIGNTALTPTSGNPVIVKICFPDECFEVFEYGAVAPGEYYSKSPPRAVKFDTAGTYSVAVTADAANKHSEISKDNNQKTFNVVINSEGTPPAEANGEGTGSRGSTEEEKPAREEKPRLEKVPESAKDPVKILPEAEPARLTKTLTIGRKLLPTGRAIEGQNTQLAILERLIDFIRGLFYYG